MIEADVAQLKLRFELCMFTLSEIEGNNTVKAKSKINWAKNANLDI